MNSEADAVSSKKESVLEDEGAPVEEDPKNQQIETAFPASLAERRERRVQGS